MPQRKTRSKGTAKKAPAKTGKSIARTITQNCFIHAYPEVVFDALVNPLVLKRWFVEEAEVEPKKGGRYVWDWGKGGKLESKITEYQPPKKLVITFTGWNSGMKEKCTFTLKPKEGGTLLHMEDTDHIAGSKGWERHISVVRGWAVALLNLKSVLESGKDLRNAAAW